LRGDYVTIDERGLRATPGEIDAPADAVRILCFGGSTMMGMGARDDHTIAAELARGLRGLGHAVAVTNFGQLGHNSTQEAIALHQLMKQGERPDIVVFYDGLNDLVAAEHTGRPDRILHEASRRAEFNLLFTDRRKELIQAALLQSIPRTIRRLRKLTGLALAGPIPPQGVILARDDTIPELARRVVAAYCGNLRLVRLLGQSYGFRTLFFWQPVITTKRVKSVDETFFEAEFTDAIALRRRLYAETMAAYRADPELRDAPDVIDLSQLFDDRPEPVYVDPYHLSEAGNAMVADAMLSRVVAQIAAISAARGGEL
jgi:lysophospholipase L1-like esterase